MLKRKYLPLLIAFAALCVFSTACSKDSTQAKSLNDPLLIAPLAIEKDVTNTEDSELVSLLENKLYENGMTVLNWIYSGAGLERDFTRAKVLNKAADGFEIDVPMTSVDDAQGKPFTYKVVKQNGNWVLDSYYYFQ